MLTKLITDILWYYVYILTWCWSSVDFILTVDVSLIVAPILTSPENTPSSNNI